MGDNAQIEWTDATWNPITGCSVVSAGCKNCYAMKLAGGRLKNHKSRLGLTVDTVNGPVWTGKVRFNKEWLNQPICWTRQRMVFVCAHADLFHPAVPDHWIDTVFGIMWACLYGRNEQDGHIFQVLTKRADRMHDYFKADRRESWARAAIHYGGGIDPDGLYDQIMDFDGPHPRVWLGVSVENQAAADERIPLLLQTPAAVRWVSAEPLLGPVDIERWIDPIGVTCMDVCGDSQYLKDGDVETVDNGKEVFPICPECGLVGSWTGYDHGIDWIVVGGESGPNARPMHPDWARSLRDQCANAGVPFLFKQWGEYVPGEHGVSVNFSKWAEIPDGETVSRPPHWFGDEASKGSQLMAKVGKKQAGRLLDGELHDGYPADRPHV